MGGPVKRWLVALGIVVVGVAAFVRLGRVTEGEEARGEPFRLVAVERGTFDLTVTASGVVEPIRRVEIRSKASGLVLELPIEEGQHVRRGDLIARLDATDATADLERARANVGIAEVEERQKSHDLERQRGLFERTLVSEAEVDTAELAASRARADLVLAQTELRRASERFDDTVIRSPVDGTVLQRAVEEGQIISSATSSASGGTVIASIADMSRVQVTAAVNEIDIGRIEPGMEGTIVADAFPQRTFPGRVIRIAPEAKVVQNVTLFDVLVEVENPGLLKSGMNCLATIELLRKDGVLLVPVEALIESRREGPREGVFVQVQTPAGFEERAVKLGLRNWRVAEVVEGLAEGDSLRVSLQSRAFSDAQEFQDRIRSQRSF
jgi:HlyD family secretion protein